jgi:hypothetical protein
MPEHLSAVRSPMQPCEMYVSKHLALLHPRRRTTHACLCCVVRHVVTSVACGSVSYCAENATLASPSQPCVTTCQSRLPFSRSSDKEREENGDARN